MYRITASLKSPLMVGGKTLNSNYRESRDYIPGSVLRAAYAKALVHRCVCEQKNYWLEYKDKDACKECEFRTVCKNFSEITFPALYPMGAAPYPFTAREEKYRNKGVESVLDILKSRLEKKEKDKRESNWKRLEGFQKDGVRVRLLHSAITRTAIDYRRSVAKESALYTQNVIVEKYLNQENELEDVVFSGEMNLSPEEEKELRLLKVLYIGADITRGFGKCHMSYERELEKDTAEKIVKRVREFNDNLTEESPYVVVDFLTDAYLGLEEIGTDSMSQTDIADEEMLAFLAKKMGLSEEKYRLTKIFKSQEILRGFDTSKGSEKEMRRNSHMVVKAGAVFVYQSLSDNIDGEELLELEKRGIGRHREHGFGKIRICDEFHMKYDVLKGDNQNG